MSGKFQGSAFCKQQKSLHDSGLITFNIVQLTLVEQGVERATAATSALTSTTVVVVVVRVEVTVVTVVKVDVKVVPVDIVHVDVS